MADYLSSNKGVNVGWHVVESFVSARIFPLIKMVLNSYATGNVFRWWLRIVLKEMNVSYEDKCNTPSKVGEYVLRLIENAEGMGHSGRSPLFSDFFPDLTKKCVSFRNKTKSWIFLVSYQIHNKKAFADFATPFWGKSTLVIYDSYKSHMESSYYPV